MHKFDGTSRCETEQSAAAEHHLFKIITRLCGGEAFGDL